MSIPCLQEVGWCLGEIQSDVARGVALTHPLSPSPFPPSPGRKGGPYFVLGVRQRANRGMLKSVLGSAGTQGASSERRRPIRWFEVEPISCLTRRWRAAASRWVCSGIGISYDRLRPILPSGSSRDLRAVNALAETSHQMRPPSFARRGERGAGGVSGGNKLPNGDRRTWISGG